MAFASLGSLRSLCVRTAPVKSIHVQCTLLEGDPPLPKRGGVLGASGSGSSGIIRMLLSVSPAARNAAAAVAGMPTVLQSSNRGGATPLYIYSLYNDWQCTDQSSLKHTLSTTLALVTLHKMIVSNICKKFKTQTIEWKV